MCQGQIDGCTGPGCADQGGGREGSQKPLWDLGEGRAVRPTVGIPGRASSGSGENLKVAPRGFAEGLDAARERERRLEDDFTGVDAYKREDEVVVG